MFGCRLADIFASASLVEGELDDEIALLQVNSAPSMCHVPTGSIPAQYTHGVHSVPVVAFCHPGNLFP